MQCSLDVVCIYIDIDRYIYMCVCNMKIYTQRKIIFVKSSHQDLIVIIRKMWIYIYVTECIVCVSGYEPLTFLSCPFLF